MFNDSKCIKKYLNEKVRVNKFTGRIECAKIVFIILVLVLYYNRLIYKVQGAVCKLHSASG